QWIHSSGHEWILDLDDLKRLLPDLTETKWLQGSAEVIPEFEMTDLRGLPFAYQENGNVVCRLRPGSLNGITGDQGAEARTPQRAAPAAEGVIAQQRSEPLRVFISYCHRDDRYREKIDSHLSLLKREGLI